MKKNPCFLLVCFATLNCTRKKISVTRKGVSTVVMGWDVTVYRDLDQSCGRFFSEMELYEKQCGSENNRRCTVRIFVFS